MQKYLYEDLYNLEETHWWHIAKRNLMISLLKNNLSGNQNRILDIGCGTGKNLEVLERFGVSFGIDSSPQAILYCKKRGIKNVVKGNIERMPFTRESFDAITALDVLEHVDDQEALKEVHRVLKRGNVLIITVPAYPELWSKWDEVLNHKRRYAKKQLENLLKENGFKILKISYAFSFLFLPALIVRLIKKRIYKNHYPSDFQISNRPINFLLTGISAIEKFFIVKIGVPFGTSLIAVALKN